MISAMLSRLKLRWRLLCLALVIAMLGGIGAAIDVAGLSSSSRDTSLDIYTRIQPFEGDLELGQQMVLGRFDGGEQRRP